MQSHVTAAVQHCPCPQAPPAAAPHAVSQPRQRPPQLAVLLPIHGASHRRAPVAPPTVTPSNAVVLGYVHGRSWRAQPWHNYTIVSHHQGTIQLRPVSKPCTHPAHFIALLHPADVMRTVIYTAAVLAILAVAVGAAVTPPTFPTAYSAKLSVVAYNGQSATMNAYWQRSPSFNGTW